MKFRISVICVSDRCSRGEREDRSGPAIIDCLSDVADMCGYRCIPDEQPEIERVLVEICDAQTADIVLTTGGTGLAPRDVTPEATLRIGEKQVPGLCEEIRRTSMEFTERAMLSRAVAVIRNRTLIVNLPGSPKAAVECLEVIRPVLGHITELLHEEVADCSRG